MHKVSRLQPCCRFELVLSPLGDQGQYVVKDPRARTYYHLGEEEHFLLTQLNGQRDGEAIRTRIFLEPIAKNRVGSAARTTNRPRCPI